MGEMCEARAVDVTKPDGGGSLNNSLHPIVAQKNKLQFSSLYHLPKKT